MSRTITHLYDAYDDATQAVRMLEEEGIPHSDISIVGRNRDAADAAGVPVGAAGDPADAGREIVTTTESTGSGAGAGASVGTVVGGGLGLLAGIGALAIPGVGPVVAAGWLVATITGAGIGAGAGGLLGSLIGAGHSEREAHIYAEGVRRGGTLVSVRVDDAEAVRVESLLNGTGRVDIAERGAEYRAAGWDRFDETRPPEPGSPPARPIGVQARTTEEAIERDRLSGVFHT